jgi:hypothetical protein
VTTIARREFMNSAVGLACAALTGSSIATTETVSQAGVHPDASASLQKRDYRNEPFCVGVALGDSITAGWTATSRELCWVSRLADSVSESQLVSMNMVNSGLGGNLSPLEAQVMMHPENQARWSATRDTWWIIALTW